MVVALVPSLVAFFIANRIFRESITEQQRQGLVALANGTRDQIEGLVTSRINDANTLSLLPAWGRFLSDRQGVGAADVPFYRFLESYLDEKGYDDLILIDPDGRVRFSLTYPDLAGLHIGDHERLGTEIARSVDAANTLLQTEISNFSWFPPAEASSAFITSPVIEDGVIAGNIVLKVPRTLLRLSANDAFLGRTGEILTLAQEGGELLFTTPPRFSPPVRANEPGHQALWDAVEQALSGHQTSSFLNDVLGNEVMAEARYIPSMNWALLVKIDTAEMYEPVDAFFRASAFIVLLALLLAFALAWAAHRLITRPLELLTAQVRRPRGAPLPEHLEIRGRHEVRELSEAFSGLFGKLRSHQRDLERKVEARTAELSTALEAAEAASRAKSEFLAVMSHELRTPLNGVIGFTEILNKTPLTPAQRQYARNANVSGHNLLRIIDDILDLSKIEAGMLELDLERTDIIELIQNSVDVVKLAAARKDLELLLRIDPTLPRHVVVDPVRLTQILCNLLGNAIKFTEAGEVELRVEYRDDRVLFSVRDTGIGISAEQKRKLFQAFSQADSSTSRRYGGTGLGLTISQSLADRMGSRIEMESELGQGSRFFFEVPVEVVDGWNEDGGAEVGEGQGKGVVKRCLIVDDHAGSRALLSEILTRHGVAVVACAGGREAIRILESDVEGFDALICDNGMPALTGQETFRIIRDELRIGAETLPVVLLYTVADAAAEWVGCELPGGVCGLEKPVNAAALLACLGRLGTGAAGAPDPGRPAADQPDGVGAAGAPGEPTAPGARPGAAADPAPAESPTILVAEDVPLNMFLITTLLATILPEATLLRAENGEEAVGLFRSENPDLVLMDVQMPKMSGLEATKEIRRLERETGTHTPIVALTAATLTEDRDRCLVAGMDQVLTKPIDTDRLKEALASVFGASVPTLDRVGP